MISTDKQELKTEVVQGLRRLAFDAPAKGVRTEPDENGAPQMYLEGIDPFQVAGLRQVKGGVELQFYSRIEAMMKLLELCEADPGDLLERLSAPGAVWAEDE